MTAVPKHGLPTVRPHALGHKAPQHRWLVQDLWADQAVGIIGGEPKCGKSFLALDIAVGVAAGVPVLRRFQVTRPGPVLLFPAEDAAHIVRERLLGIAHAAHTDFDALDIHLIDIPYLMLDQVAAQQRLEETVERIHPRVLILDPFVRLHHIDENVAAEVAPILAFLRRLQRAHQCAVVLVHHARKGATRLRGGQALRGSSELHAWGDSNLYLRRAGEHIVMSIEHRAHPSAATHTLDIGRTHPGALGIVEHAQPTDLPKPSPEQRILSVLQGEHNPIPQRQIRERAQLRAQTTADILARLVDQGTLVHDHSGYRIA